MGQGTQVWRRWPVVAGVVALVLALAGAGAAWAVVSHQNNLKIQAWADAAGDLAELLDLADTALVRASELDQATGDLGLEEARQELNTKIATLKAGVKDALTDHPAIERRVADQSDAQSGAQSGVSELAQSGGASSVAREVYVVNDELRPPAGELEQARKQLEQAQVALEEATSNLEDVSEAVAGKVAAAREELQGAVSGAVADLQAQVEAASKVLTDSKGKVADDKTRTALEDALGAAKSLVEQLSKPLSDVGLVEAEALVGEQVKALQGAQKKVDASIAQKSAADAAAQAAANNGGGSGAGEGWTGTWDSDWSEGGSWGDWTGSTGSSGSGGGYVPQSDRCDPRWPCSVIGDDGITHNQIWPDSNGEYVLSGDLW